MPATGARRGHLVYHWKHGWIPLDHYAALQKAHHSKTGAVKEMEKRGIPVPKGYKSDHKPSAPTVAPKAAPKATRAKVRDLPAADTFKGVHSETHMGERVTVRKGKQWGTIQSEINGHVVGTGYGHSNADAVKHLDSTKGTVAHAKANPANYTNGFGEASYGMKLGAKAPAAPKASPAPTHSAGMDPHAVPSSGGRKYSDAEIKRGYDMSGKAIPKAGEPAPAEKRAHVTHSGDGTLLSIDRNDTEARDAAKAAGFRWSSNLGSWYLPRNQTESTRRYKVSQLQAKLGNEHVHVEDSGHGKTTTAAEREAARKEASATRADRLDSRAAKHQAEADARYKAARDIMDRIPLGQPILVGHHSERGARADQKRIANHGDKMLLAMTDAKRAQQAADAARHNATTEDSPLKRQRRIDRNEAELRSIDKRLTEHGIATKAPEQAARVGMKPLSPDYHAKLTAARAELADQVAHDKAQIAASGHKAVTAADIKAGDMVQYRGRTHVVTKVNKTTVSVPTPYSWEDKVPINQVGKHIPLSTQSDSAVQTAYQNATHAKVKTALAAELKRRGLLTGN